MRHGTCDVLCVSFLKVVLQNTLACELKLATFAPMQLEMWPFVPQNCLINPPQNALTVCPAGRRLPFTSSKKMECQGSLHFALANMRHVLSSQWRKNLHWRIAAIHAHV